MLSAFLVSALLGAQAPVELGAAIQDVRRAFIEDGANRVSATATHRVISHADGSLELQGSQSLRLDLLSLKRDQGPSCSAHFLERVAGLDDPHTVRASRACEVEERWTNEAPGLSHAFTVQRAPSGSGGLTLRLSVEGPWHHQDELGHVFKGPGAAASLRYGNAFVVRGGNRFPIPVVHVEGGLELRVPAALVEAPGAFPMEIDPVLSAEVELDQLINASAPPSPEEGPAIAVNASGVALVVWVDSRRQLGTDIFGARISPQGTLTDQVGIPLVIAPGHQVRPTVCADGNNFLIAWDTPLLDGGFQVRAKPVSAGGALGQEFLVAPGSQPSLASRGGDAGMLLAYVDPNSLVQVGQITANGAGTPLGSSTGNEVAEHPALAAGPGGWYVAWQSTVGGAPVASIRLMASSMLGGVIPLYTNTSANQAQRPTVALSTWPMEEQAFVAWEEGGSVKAAQYSTLAVTNFFSVPNATSPALVRTSLAGGALPTLGYFISLNRLQLLDLNDGGTTNVMVGPRSNELVMASSGSKVMAAWTESPIGFSGDLHGAAIGSGPTVNNQTLLLSRAAATQRTPVVALVDGRSEGLAVWVQGANDVRAAKVVVGPSGLLMGNPFDLAILQYQPVDELAIAAEGASNTYLAVWRQGTSIMGAFTDDVGPAQTPFTISNSGATAGPAVAFDPGSGSFVVAWTQDIGAPKVTSVTVSRSAGSISLQRVHSLEAAPRVAVNCMRSRCLVAWETPTREVRGTVYGTTNSGSFTWNAAALPAVANDGTNFYLGWSTGSGLGFSRVDFTSGTAVSVPVGVQASSGAVITRVSMASAIPPIVSWSELSVSELSSVHLARVEPQGAPTLVGPGSAPSLGLGTVETDPSGVIVYQRYVVGDGDNAFRAFGKAVNFAPDASFIDAGLDAGRPDAGVDAGVDGGLDAGPDTDGGVNPSDGGVDAGVDAGSADGGVMMFDTTGCTCNSGSAAPLILLALFAFRRRRSQGRSK